MALNLCQNFVSAQYLGEQIDIISPNCIYAFILIYLGIVTRHFLHICTKGMALDLSQNFLSALQITIRLPHLENKLTEFHQILCIYIHIDKI